MRDTNGIKKMTYVEYKNPSFKHLNLTLSLFIVFDKGYSLNSSVLLFGLVMKVPKDLLWNFHIKLYK